MKINEKECLPVLECDVNGEGLLKLDKGAALRLTTSPPVTCLRVMAEFTYYQTDHKGRIYYMIPLRLVPLRWVLLLLSKLGFRKSIRRGWYVFEPYRNIVTKTVSDKITSFKIGVLKDK